MKTTFFSVATAVVALTRTVRATGSALVQNKCNYDVYLWHISTEKTDSEPTVLKANTGSYTEDYVTCKSGGVSLKLSKSDSLSGDDITQFEYTLESSMLWYDLSNVNCEGKKCPFQGGGMSLTPSSDCSAVTCAAGADTCPEAYTLWNDDWASHGCATSTDLTMVLCSSGSSDDSGSGSGYIGVSSSSTLSTPSSTASPTTSKKQSTKAKTSTKAKPTASSYDQINVAAVSSSSSSSSPSPSPSPSTPSSTTLATSTKKATTSKAAPSTTSVPAEFNEIPYTQWYTEVAYETVHSTVVVTVRDNSHEQYHKNKARHAEHPHQRRHHQLHQLS